MSELAAVPLDKLQQSERYLWDYQSSLMTSAYEDSDSYDRALDKVTLRLSQVRAEIRRRKIEATPPLPHSGVK